MLENVQFGEYILVNKIIFRYLNFNYNMLSAQNNWVGRANSVMRTRLKTKQIWTKNYNEICPNPVVRVEICRDRRNRQSCKNFVSCVNFSRIKLMIMLHIRCFIASENSHDFQYIKLFCPKIGMCKFFLTNFMSAHAFL